MPVAAIFFNNKQGGNVIIIAILILAEAGILLAIGLLARLIIDRFTALTKLILTVQGFIQEEYNKLFKN